MMKLKNVLLLILVTCTTKVLLAAGPETEALSASSYTKLYYVDGRAGKDEGDGSKQSPWKSLKLAMSKATAETGKRVAILVAEGNYAEGGLTMKPKVDVFGGFNSNNWKRDIEKYRTIINGGGKLQLFIGANDARIDGFTLSNGSVLGN